MRLIAAVVIGLLVMATFVAAEPGKGETTKRYGIDADLKTYPQGTPKETLASVLKAVENKRIDYVVAQLADPEYVDERVKRTFGGKFEEHVTDTRTKLDPPAVKLLDRFLKEGDWVGKESPVSVVLKDVKDRAVTFVKIGDRWYMQNNDKPE
jgi:ABC-type amino acid transport substrate-binding protein